MKPASFSPHFDLVTEAKPHPDSSHRCLHPSVRDARRVLLLQGARQAPA